MTEDKTRHNCENCSCPAKKSAGKKPKTMCGWAEIANESNRAELDALRNDPKFICRRCGRSANRQENLCQPAKIIDA